MAAARALSSRCGLGLCKPCMSRLGPQERIPVEPCVFAREARLCLSSPSFGTLGLITLHIGACQSWRHLCIFCYPMIQSCTAAHNSPKANSSGGVGRTPTSQMTWGSSV